MSVAQISGRNDTHVYPNSLASLVTPHSSPLIKTKRVAEQLQGDQQEIKQQKLDRCAYVENVMQAKCLSEIDSCFSDYMFKEHIM